MFSNILLFIIVVLLCFIVVYLKSLTKKLISDQSGQIGNHAQKRFYSIRLKNQRVHKNGFSKELVQEIKDRILKEIEINEHYTDASFKLEDLAKLIGLPKHQVSKVINQEFGMDFNSFINKFRIEKAKELFLSKDDFQISDVMYDVGFNNSTTFNRAFKKYTDNLTPTDYLTMQVKLLEAN